MVANCFVNKIPAWWLRKILYKSLGMKIGKYARIGIGTIVVYPKRISIGDRAIINEYCFLDGRGELYIGNNVSISIYSRLVSASHKLNNDYFEYQYSPIVIENYAFVGTGAIVLEGTHLGEGCCIGAGAVVKGHYEPNSIYIGNPAVKTCSRNCNYKYELYQDYYFR